MKVNIGADTSDFEKGAKQVKQGLKDLDKTGTQALSSLGDAFGVNTGKIGQMTSAIKGLGQKLSECGNTGVAAFGNILKSIGPVGTALAGLGISAAIAGFKALKDEADAFKQTVAGANIEMATAAYVDTYRQVLRDFRGDFGKALAETESGFTKFFKTLGANLKANISTGASWGVLIPGLQAQGMASYTMQLKTANERANDAAYLTEKIGQLEWKRKQNAVELAKINDQIAAQLNLAKDTSNSIAVRSDAIAVAETLIAQKKEMVLPIEQKIAAYYNELAGLATNTKDQEELRLQAAAREYEVDRELTQEATSLLRVKNSIGRATDAEIAKTNELIKKQKELEAAIAAVRSKWSSMNEGLAGLSGGVNPSFPGVNGPALSVIPKIENKEYWRDVINAQLGDITIGIGFEADTQKIQDISNEVNSLLSSSISKSAELIGNLVGTLAGGGDAWGDFKNAALSAFGDMAIAVGKIAIAAGLASEGIQAALHMDNPYIAIAAGAALIALGSAVKSSLSAVASGDYSAAGGGYSGGYPSSGNGGGYETREVNVTVTGSLEANGDQLIAVINNTNKRNYYTR